MHSSLLLGGCAKTLTKSTLRRSDSHHRHQGRNWSKTKRNRIVLLFMACSVFSLCFSSGGACDSSPFTLACQLVSFRSCLGNYTVKISWEQLSCLTEDMRSTGSYDLSANSVSRALGIGLCSRCTSAGLGMPWSAIVFILTSGGFL